MPVKKPHPIYLTDDFPRDGCTIAIDIQGTSYGIALFAPGRKSHPIEVYSCRTSEALQVLVECLATGRKVPKGYREIGLEAQQ
ncbi:hypothetical protein [Cupriavidus sp. D39]|uniref:hypothetical protein n=1 Tax=Cupriavidus sp. D39 TaxID=2997877 RepID=UPI00226FAFEF|nr:hypothetical protein [Cupriavidus sp. D39]MCY0854303.1 hypothetical protein [Cupriavidus sp. D39]